MLSPEKIEQMDKLTGIQPATSTSKRGLDRFAELEALDDSSPKPRSKILDVAVGAAKGLGSTASNISNIGQKIAENTLGRVLPDEVVQSTREVFDQTPEDIASTEQTLTPTNTPQKIGKGIEQVAEFLVPGAAGARVAKVPGIANLAERAGVEALGAGSVTLGQTGDVDDALQGGAIGAAFPIAGKTLDIVKNEKNAGRLINSLIKTKLNDLSFGKNPGKTVAELGIVGNSLEDLERNIVAKKDEIGLAIGDLMSKATVAGKKVDLADVLEPITSAIKQAKKAELSNAPLITKLENLYTDLTKGKKLDNLTPDEAFQLKQDVASLTRFTGNPSDDKAANAALMGVYRGIKDKINKVVDNKLLPELNDKYANLLTAAKATQKREEALQGQNLLSLGGKTAGVGVGLATLLSGGAAIPAVLAGLAVAGGEKAVSSPAVRTRLAKWMASKTANERSEILKVAPYLKGLVITNAVED